MGNVLVESSSLSAIANAIRNKNGLLDKYKPKDMAKAINDINTGSVPTGTKEISVTQNGTITENVSGFASAQITTNVPNSYSASDEGKVVSNGLLVGQTSAEYTSNNTYDTTLIDEVTVNVSGGITPTGTKQISISQNGTTTEDVTNYANAEITVNVSGGGGSSDTIDSDYIKLEYAIVTIGANSVANATQVIPYLLGLADFSTTDALHAWCSVIDHNGWIQNQYVCTDINISLNSSRKFYRYKNNAISSTQEVVSYDAKLNPGDKYLVSCIRWKGAPTV